MTRETPDGPDAALLRRIECAREICQTTAEWWGFGSVPHRRVTRHLDRLLAILAQAQADQNEHGVDEERRLARDGSILDGAP